MITSYDLLRFFGMRSTSLARAPHLHKNLSSTPYNWIYTGSSGLLLKKCPSEFPPSLTMNKNLLQRITFPLYPDLLEAQDSAIILTQDLGFFSFFTGSSL